MAEHADVQDWARWAQSSDYAKAMGVYSGLGRVSIWKLCTPGAQAYHSIYIYYGDAYARAASTSATTKSTAYALPSKLA